MLQTNRIKNGEPLLTNQKTSVTRRKSQRR